MSKPNSFCQVWCFFPTNIRITYIYICILIHTYNIIPSEKKNRRNQSMELKKKTAPELQSTSEHRRFDTSERSGRVVEILYPRLKRYCWWQPEIRETHHLENIVYHFCRQLWLVLGVKLMEINSNLFSRQLSLDSLPPLFTKFYTSKRWLVRRISEPSTTYDWKTSLGVLKGNDPKAPIHPFFTEPMGRRVTFVTPPQN